MAKELTFAALIVQWQSGRLADRRPRYAGEAGRALAEVAIEGRETSRERVLTDAELGEVWRAAGVLGWPYGDFIQFLLLTCQREAEAAGLHRPELAEDLSVWSVESTGRSREEW